MLEGGGIYEIHPFEQWDEELKVSTGSDELMTLVYSPRGKG